VLESKEPNWVLPVTKSTELVIVCTTNVCAVNVPATVKALANEDDAAYDAEVATTAYDAVVANDAVPDNDPLTTVIGPFIVTLPDTANEPVMVG